MFRVLHGGLDWGWWGKLSPDCLDRTDRGQIAGGETAMMRAALETAALGHEVAVVTDVPASAVYKGVRFEPKREWFRTARDGGPWDAIVIWGDPDDLATLTEGGDLSPDTVRICAQQCNDFTRPDAVQGYVDVYVSPSWSHARRLSKKYRVAIERFRVIPNAIEPARFRFDRPRDPDLVYAASSPDRGLHHLLNAWPAVKRVIPEARLEVYYEMQRWTDLADGSELTHPNLRTRVAQVRAAKDAVAGLDVSFMGGVNQQAVIDCACTAGVFAYPCDPYCYTEGFATAVLEAICAGAVPVISDADALEELYQDSTVMVRRADLCKPAPEHRDGLTFFGSAIVNAIRTARQQQADGRLGYAFDDERGARALLERCSWARNGQMWVSMIEASKTRRVAA